MWYHAQVIQHYWTGLPADVAVNNLYFQSGSPEPADGEMNKILTVINNAWAELEDYRAGILKTVGGMTVKIYDVTAPPNSPPLRIGGPYTMGSPTVTTNLPAEVAAVVSFHASTNVSMNPARRRGRNYIGPLNTSASDPGDATTPAKLSTGFRAALVAYAGDLMAANVAPNAVEWCVYSRTEQNMFPVVGGWVDDAFDTQRRRGQPTNVRTIW